MRRFRAANHNLSHRGKNAFFPLAVSRVALCRRLAFVHSSGTGRLNKPSGTPPGSLLPFRCLFVYGQAKKEGVCAKQAPSLHGRFPSGVTPLFLHHPAGRLAKAHHGAATDLPSGCSRSDQGLLTLFVARLGEGEPLALLSMSVRLLCRLTDTALWAAFRSPPAREGFPSPKPPSLPQRAFAMGRVEIRGKPAPKGTWGMHSLLLLIH